jgi:Glycosyltransferase 61
MPMTGKTGRAARPEAAPSPALDLPGLLLALAAEVGAARPRAWGDSVAQTLRLIGLRLPPRANLQFQLAEARHIPGAELRLVSPLTVRRLAPPICREEPPRWLIDSSHVVKSPDLHVVRLPGGALVQFGDVPVAIAGDRRTLVRDASGRYAALLHYAPFDLAHALDGAREVRGPVFLLSDDIWPPNYSHWLLDALPRLAALELAGFRPENLMLATSPLTQPYQRETLRLCGWAAERIIELAPMQALRARELFVTTDQPQPPHPMFKGAPWAARYLRRHLGAQGGRADPAGGRRLYISRGDTGWRRVLNEPELVAMLAQRGFESVSLSGMSVGEQAKIFDAAAWIVAPHGAGLANLVFSRPEATVLEIFPRSFGTPAFHCVAAAGRLRYGCHIVPEANVVRREGVGYDDMRVDPDVLADTYGDLLPGE